MPVRRVSIAKQRFGMLTVLERYAGEYWMVRCDCGKESFALQHNLKSGNTKSCGCQKFTLEHRAKLSAAAKKRGQNGHHQSDRDQVL